MIKTHIAIGFLTGLAANVMGIFLYILLFSETGVEITLRDAMRNDYLGTIIALGAALNFVPFFIFLKKDLLYHARGVLLATILVAVIIAITKIL